MKNQSQWIRLSFLAVIFLSLSLFASPLSIYSQTQSMISDQGSPVVTAVNQSAQGAIPDPSGWSVTDLFWYVLSALLLLYEYIVAKVPTNRTLSVITWIFRIIRALIPDKYTNGTSSLSGDMPSLIQRLRGVFKPGPINDMH